jgi:hypothetical protein
VASMTAAAKAKFGMDLQREILYIES